MMNNLLRHPFMSVDPHQCFGPSATWHHTFNPFEGDKVQTGYSSQSYSYSSRTGPDGKPIVRESRHSVNGDGNLREEQFELFDGAENRRERGTARAIGDRSVVEREVSRGESAEPERHVEFNNLAEDEAEKFNQEWQRSSAKLRSTGLLGGPSDRGADSRIAIEDRRQQDQGADARGTRAQQQQSGGARQRGAAGRA